MSINLQNDFLSNLKASYRRNKFTNSVNDFLLDLKASYKGNKLVNT